MSRTKENHLKLVIRQVDNEGKTYKVEFFLKDGFCAIHYHGWTTEEKFAKFNLKFRKIWGRYYFAQELYIPWGMVGGFAESLNDKKISKSIVDWIEQMSNKYISESKTE